MRKFVFVPESVPILESIELEPYYATKCWTHQRCSKVFLRQSTSKQIYIVWVSARNVYVLYILLESISLEIIQKSPPPLSLSLSLSLSHL